MSVRPLAGERGFPVILLAGVETQKHGRRSENDLLTVVIGRVRVENGESGMQFGRSRVEKSLLCMENGAPRSENHLTAVVIGVLATENGASAVVNRSVGMEIYLLSVVKDLFHSHDGGVQMVRRDVRMVTGTRGEREHRMLCGGGCDFSQQGSRLARIFRLGAQRGISNSRTD
jgi:hypothetical protein